MKNYLTKTITTLDLKNCKYRREVINDCTSIKDDIVLDKEYFNGLLDGASFDDHYQQSFILNYMKSIGVTTLDYTFTTTIVYKDIRVSRKYPVNVNNGVFTIKTKDTVYNHYYKCCKNFYTSDTNNYEDIMAYYKKDLYTVV